jgi:hypothetical protein
MLFIMLREIECARIECAAFVDLDEVTACYEEAAYIVRNAPGEDPEDDPAVVAGAVLYAADTQDPNFALEMVKDGRAVLMEIE